MFDTATNAYHELRALWSEFIATHDEVTRQQLVAAAEVFLGLHCASCGGLIEEFLRRREPGEEYCLACINPPPADSSPAPGALKTLDGEDDIPF